MANFDALPAEIAAHVASLVQPVSKGWLVQECAGRERLRELLALRCASRSCKDAVRRAAEQYKEKDEYVFTSRSSAQAIAAMGRVFGSACQSLSFACINSEERVSALQNFVTSTKGQLRYFLWVSGAASGGECLCSTSALLEMCRASPLLTTLKVHGAGITSAANLDDFASAVSSACPLLDCVVLPSPRSPAEDYQWHFPRSKRLNFNDGITYGPIRYDNVELTLRSCVHAVEIDFGGFTTVPSRLVDLVLGAPTASRLKALDFGSVTVISPELVLRLASGLGALSNLQLPYGFDGGPQFFRSLVLARPTIVQLDLGFCNIENESLKIICEGLRLEHLDLADKVREELLMSSDIRLAGPLAVEAIVESQSAQTLRSLDIAHLPFLPGDMLRLLRGCPKLATLDWEAPEGYFDDFSFSPIQDGPAVDALNALLKSRGRKWPIYFFDHYGPDLMLHVGGGAVDKTGQAFRLVGYTEGWWTVQAPGASEPLSRRRRSWSLTPCPLPPDGDDDGSLLVT